MAILSPEQTGIFIEKKPVNGVGDLFSHAYLTRVHDNGIIEVIRGGPQNDSLFDFGNIKTAQGIELADSRDAYGANDTASSRHRTAIDIGDRDENSVWTALQQSANKFGEAKINYDMTGPNSNSLVGSVLSDNSLSVPEDFSTTDLVGFTDDLAQEEKPLLDPALDTLTPVLNALTPALNAIAALSNFLAPWQKAIALPIPVTGMSAGKHFDPVLGIDIHFVIIPPSPAPIPIPHPFIALTIDIFDYLPIIGSTVKVNGLHRAQAGTTSKTFHIPFGASFIPLPGNEGEMFMGSSTVLVDDEPFSYLALPVLSCWSIGMPFPFRLKPKPPKFSFSMPTSVVLPIPWAKPVKIGGSPTISLMSFAMSGIFSAFGAAFKKLKKIQKNSKKWKSFSDWLHKKLIPKKSSKKIQNMISNTICSVTGHPVDVASGKMFTEAVDIELPGPLPFIFKRIWYSVSTHKGDLGHGWHHNYDMGLYLDKQGAILRLEDGRHAVFPMPAKGEKAFNPIEKLYFINTGKSVHIETLQGLRYQFGSANPQTKEQPLVSVSDSNNNTIQLIRNHKGTLKGIRDSAGRLLDVISDSQGRIRQIRAPDLDEANIFSPKKKHRQVSYDYSAEGDLIAATDALDHPFKYYYQQHLVIKETHRNGQSYYFEYEGQGENARCIKTWGDKNVYYRELHYDLLKQCTEVTDYRGGITLYEWDAQGIVLKETDPLGGETHFEYDEYNNKIAEIDPEGNASRYTYDQYGQLMSSTDAEGNITQLTYDQQHNPITVTDANNAVWQFSYDNKHNLTRSKDPQGNKTHYQYNSKGLTIAIKDALNREHQYHWNDRGELTAEYNAKQARAHYRYDAHGNIIEIQDLEQRKTFYDYNRMGHLLQVIDGEGKKTRLRYNEEGKLIIYADSSNRMTRFDYQQSPMLHHRINPDGTEFHYEYDKEYNLTALINEKGERYQLDYDLNERLIKETGFDGREQSYEYDKAGALIRHLDGVQRVINFRRDSLGRLNRKTTSDGEMIDFEYDQVSRLVAADNQHRKLKFVYDDIGNMLEEHQDEHILKHQYSATGERLETLLPDQKIINYQYDATGSFTEVKIGEQLLAHIQRDQFGREITRYNSTTETTTDYDPMGRLIKQQLNQQGEYTPIVKRRYRYNQQGQLDQIKDLKRGTKQFIYDQRDYLLEVQNDQIPERFAYDPAGNLLDTNGNGQQGKVKGNRLLMQGDRHFEYDDVGNLIKESRGKAQCLVTEYQYDHLNQLSSSTRNGQTVHYRYDPLGRRISKTDDFGTTEFLWNNHVLLSETRASDSKTYLFEPNSFLPLVMMQNGHVYHYHLDHLGTPMEMTNQQGKLVWQARYRAYGSIQQYDIETVENPFRFQGQYFDNETGLHYNFFRYYDPSIAIYLSPDPIGLLGGVNSQAYVHDPNGWVDPLGLAGKCRNPDDIAHKYGGTKVGENRYEFPDKKSAKQAASEISGNLGYNPRTVPRSEYRESTNTYQQRSSNRVIGKHSADGASGYHDHSLGHSRFNETRPHFNAWSPSTSTTPKDNVHLFYPKK